jgi:hypothetical protein
VFMFWRENIDHHVRRIPGNKVVSLREQNVQYYSVVVKALCYRPEGCGFETR